RKIGMFKIKCLVAGIDPDAPHVVYFMADPKIFLPIWPSQVDGAKRKQEVFRLRFACFGKPGIDTLNIFMKKRLKTSRPGLPYPVLMQFCYQGVGFSVF